MKKIIILENNGGRLANQLWQFISIYAYCLEKEYSCENYSFFRYAHYFNFTVNNKLVYWLFFKFHNWHKNTYFTKIIYFIFKILIKNLFPKRIILDDKGKFLLPPSNNSIFTQNEIIKLIDSSNDSSWYFYGWLFTNPAGLMKYHDNIVEYFKPKEQYYSQVEKFVKKLRNGNKRLVGVHIRQGDFKTWMGGKFYFSLQEIKMILDDFLINQTDFNKENTIFILCSDGHVDKEIFSGLNIIQGLGSEISDLFTLAATDLIIGNPASSYGAWASYYGNIPIFEFSKEKIDWSAKIINFSQ